MKALMKENKWECLITSFAMVTGISVEEFRSEIGHDGSQKITGDHHLGFHTQEIIQVLMTRGFSVTPIELIPVLRYPSGVTMPLTPKPDFFDACLMGYTGVVEGIVGMTKSRPKGHAMAFNQGILSDPDNGKQILYRRTVNRFAITDNFTPKNLWIVTNG